MITTPRAPRRRRTAAAAALLWMTIAATACGGGGDDRSSDPILAADAVVLPMAPSAAELANTTYRGILDRPVTLTAGRWEGEPFVEGGSARPSVGLVDHFSLQGDLDGDGALEAAALLWSSSGGSGTRDYLAVVERTTEGLANPATVLIGDRVQVRWGRIDNGDIVLGLVRHGPEDPACCPTETAEVRWSLDHNGLRVVADRTSGRLSLAELEGPTWRLLTLGWNQPVPGEVEISLKIEGDRVSGSAGCNRYNAAIAGPEPGQMVISEAVATKRACPEAVMSLESRFLEAVTGASEYDFLAGRLALTCSTDDGMSTLIFEASETP